MRRRRKQRGVYAFIDSQNLNVSVQRNGWKMDWKKFRQFLADKFGVTEAYMFIGYVPEYENLYEQMHNAGYKVVLKPTFDMTRVRPESTPDQKGDNKEEDRHVKGNVDADLVLWAMKEIDSYDKAILVSGDGDFYSLVEFLHEKNKLLNLLTPGSHYSSLYNRFEEFIVRLDHHKKDLQYYDRKQRSPRSGSRSRSSRKETKAA